MEGVGRAGGAEEGLWRRLIKKQAIKSEQQSKREERKWGWGGAASIARRESQLN